MSEFDEETEYLDAIYNVSKGSTKKNSVGPYTKTDIAAQLGAATGIGAGVSLAGRGNRGIKYVKSSQKRLDNMIAGKDPKNFSPATAKSVNNIEGGLKAFRSVSSKARATGLGLAGLGAAGMLASDASAYKRNKGKNMKVSKSAYNMLPKGFSAARKAKSLEMAPAKFSAKKQAAYDRMGLSTTQGDIADIAGAGVLGAGIGASLPPMYRKRDKMAAARKMNRNKMAPVAKSAFGVEHTDISKGLPSNLKNSIKGADKIAAQRTAATGNREKGKKAGMKALKSDYPSLVNSRVKGKMFSTKKNVTANTTVSGAAGRNMYSDKSGLTNYGPTRGRYKGENAKLNGSRQGDYLLTRAGANAEGRRRRNYSPIGADLKEISNENLARLKPAARNRPLRNI